MIYINDNNQEESDYNNNEKAHDQNNNIKKRSIIHWKSNNNKNNDSSSTTTTLKLDWRRVPDTYIHRYVDFHDIEKFVVSSSSSNNTTTTTHPPRRPWKRDLQQQQQQRQQQIALVKKLIILYKPERGVPYYSLFGEKNFLTKNLMGLYLRNCKFASLPDSVGCFENLKVLEIRSCHELDDIPESIFQQPLIQKSLQCLTIHDCRRLVMLPSSIGQLGKLTNLSICDCRVVFLPTSFGELKTLEELDLRDLKLQLPLSMEFSQLTNLKRLYFKNDINIAGMFSAKFFDLIAKNTSNLQHLYLQERAYLLNRIPLIPNLKSLSINIHARRNVAAATGGGLRLLDDAWKENSNLRELSIDSDGAREVPRLNILRDLPKTLEKLSITNCKIENVLDSLMNESLPPGLQVLSIVNWHRPSYSTSERIDCIVSLAERYERLGRIRISESGRKRGFDSGLVQVPLPRKPTYLLKFNRCGRILIQRGNNNLKDEASSLQGSDANMDPRTPLPCSFWPTVLARVNDIVNREIVGYCRLNTKEELQEIEASILFQFLREGAFL